MNAFRSPSLSSIPVALWLLASALVVAAPACAAASDDAERHRIAEERAAIAARYAARERECRERFVVTSCIDDAKVERRHGLDALRARQLKLDEEKRRARTAERSAELAAKAADDARREQERAARAASAPVPREPRSLEPRREKPAASAASASTRDRAGAPVDGVGSKAGPTESAAERREREERHRASFATRQQQAKEHRQEVDDKAAEAALRRAPAAPLPVPASAPAR